MFFCSPVYYPRYENIHTIARERGIKTEFYGGKKTRASFSFYNGQFTDYLYPVLPERPCIRDPELITAVNFNLCDGSKAILFPGYFINYPKS